MKNPSHSLWMTQTAVCLALLVVLQAATMPLGSTLITGSVVNLLLIYLLQMRSLSRPYLMPILPFRKKSLGNTIIRAPFSFLRRRARIARPIDEYRGIGK